MLPKNIVFVDIETTGLSVLRDRVIEIGLLRIENNILVETYQTLLNPETYISPSIQSMTGITKQELENAPIFYEIKGKLSSYLRDAVFVAHNVRFDYGFLRNEFKRAGENFSTKHFCTVKLARQLFPHLGRYNLDNIISNFNISCSRRHRAFDDAQVLWNFYQVAQKQCNEELFTSAVNLALKKPSLPISLPAKTLETLPEGPGVYIFYGQQGAPLYVGKSINIRERVLSHFASDHSSTKEMKIAQQIESIETITTSGELGALVKESFLVKKLQPLYNRQLRISRKLVILKKRINSDGYNEMIIETIDRIDHTEASEILGVFRSQRQAKEFLIALVKEYSLCERLLQLEKTKSACFAYRLGNCNGACIKKEHPLRYNMRFTEAFSKNKIKPWPFQGPIVIREKDPLNENIETFLIDKWCLLGSVVSDDGENMKSIAQEYIFDLDTYKILKKYLEQKKNYHTITTISSQQLTNFSYTFSSV